MNKVSNTVLEEQDKLAKLYEHVASGDMFIVARSKPGTKALISLRNGVAWSYTSLWGTALPSEFQAVKSVTLTRE